MAGTSIPPVQVRFAGLYEPDIEVLTESLIPYGRWSEEHLASELPVDVQYPAQISERMAVLSDYLAPGRWPDSVPVEAMSTTRYIIEFMIPNVTAEIVRGIRLMVAAAIRDDGSRAVVIRDQVHLVFLSSMVLALARSLKAYVLISENDLDWGEEFYEMKRVYSPNIIYGLSYIARRFGHWDGWTDADFHEEFKHHRLFVPILTEYDFGDPEPISWYSPDDVRRLIIPQLLSIEAINYKTIQRLIFEPMKLRRHLVERNEQFVDSETCSDHSDAINYIIRIASDRIISRLLETPESERWRAYIKLTARTLSISPDIARRVKQAIQLG